MAASHQHHRADRAQAGRKPGYLDGSGPDDDANLTLERLLARVCASGPGPPRRRPRSASMRWLREDSHCTTSSPCPWRDGSRRRAPGHDPRGLLVRVHRHGPARLLDSVLTPVSSSCWNASGSFLIRLPPSRAPHPSRPWGLPPIRREIAVSIRPRGRTRSTPAWLFPADSATPGDRPFRVSDSSRCQRGRGPHRRIPRSIRRSRSTAQSLIGGCRGF